MTAKPWKKFRVIRNNLHYDNSECLPLVTIYHVAHVPTSVRIIEDKKIQANLVYDESRLNKERIRVVWLSPNDWVNGFRYGNVRFMFDWKTLVKNKKYYWIESMNYTPEACRILITENNYNSKYDLYDPKIGNGPWWHDVSGDKHYWNGKYCLEIMLEGDIPFSYVNQVDFVTHHSRQCSISPSSCIFLGVSNREAGSQFVANIISRNILINIPGFIDNINNKFKPSSILKLALNSLLVRCNRVNISSWGNVTSTDRVSIPLARAIMGAYSRKDNKEFLSLSKMFCSRSDLETSIAKVIAINMGITDAKSLLDD